MNKRTIPAIRSILDLSSHSITVSKERCFTFLFWTFLLVVLISFPSCSGSFSIHRGSVETNISNVSVEAGDSISIKFSNPVDIATVTKNSVFVVPRVAALSALSMSSENVKLSSVTCDYNSAVNSNLECLNDTECQITPELEALKDYTLCISNSIKFLNGSFFEGTSFDFSTSSPPAPSSSFLKIFVTAGTWQGDLGGVAGADAKCMNDANKPEDGKTYKAFLANTYRHAVPNKYWVLRANTEYRRSDGTTVIGTTNTNSVFTAPLINSFSGENIEVWTGLKDNWNTYILGMDEYQYYGPCKDWQFNDSLKAFLYDGSFADAGTKTSSAWYYDRSACDQYKALLCVEQPGTPAPAPAFLNIFVTIPNFNGGMDGVSGADSYCATDYTDEHFEGPYKALIVDGINRRAEIGNQVDWVLNPNTEYRRIFDSEVIGITTADSVFEAPLLNKFSTDDNKHTWTGLNPDWTTADNTCLLWDNSVSPNSGLIGFPYEEDETAWSDTTDTCDQYNYLICVEQLETWPSP